jgi:ubiquinone/menaquinone biosynthesis C-methylase UbiE
LLHERGTDVIAVEPGDGMAAQFRSVLPEVPIIRGDGNALLLTDASRDLITHAQSWHWTDTSRSVPEALRLLRPGGAPAICRPASELTANPRIHHPESGGWFRRASRCSGWGRYGHRFGR